MLTSLSINVWGANVHALFFPLGLCPQQKQATSDCLVLFVAFNHTALFIMSYDSLCAAFTFPYVLYQILSWIE